MTDRELLRLAAKAAGLAPDAAGFFGNALTIKCASGVMGWNPLANDGDALRLAVKLGIEVTPFLSGACAVTTPSGWKRTESGYENGFAAARRAITRAAAEIGKAMP